MKIGTTEKNIMYMYIGYNGEKLAIFFKNMKACYLLVIMLTLQLRHRNINLLLEIKRCIWSKTQYIMVQGIGGIREIQDIYCPKRDILVTAHVYVS